MEIRLILFKEISFGISLDNQFNSFYAKHLLFLLRKEKSKDDFSFLK